MKAQLGQLVDADVPPLIFEKSGHKTESIVCLWVVFGQIPRARSKGIEQLYDKKRGLCQFLRAKRVIAHFAGDGGNKSGFIHRVKG